MYGSPAVNSEDSQDGDRRSSQATFIFPWGTLAAIAGACVMLVLTLCLSFSPLPLM